MRAWFDDKEMELGGPRSARLCESVRSDQHRSVTLDLIELEILKFNYGITISFDFSKDDPVSTNDYLTTIRSEEYFKVNQF